LDNNKKIKQEINKYALSMSTSSAKLSAFMKLVATFIAICCVVSTSNGAEFSDDISTNDLDRNLRSAVSHYLRGGRASATSHYLRGRRSNGLVLLSNGDNEDIDTQEDVNPLYERGLRNSISHFLRGRRSNPVNHFLRGKKAAPSGYNHFLRGGRAGVNHFLRGRKAGVNHFLRGRKSTVNHFLRGKKSLPEDDETMDSSLAYEEPSDMKSYDILY